MGDTILMLTEPAYFEDDQPGEHGMGRRDFKPGSSSRSDFYDWINERHSIWLRRSRGEPKPWTQDPIMQTYKFTNVFRQLDRGTIVLNEAIRPLIEQIKDPHSKVRVPAERAAWESLELRKKLFFNVVWYRLFNHAENMTELGLVDNAGGLRSRLKARRNRGCKVFTSAHMTTGEPGRDKIETYLEVCDKVFELAEPYVLDMEEDGTMEGAFDNLLHLPLVGPFVAYELVCDFRFTPLLPDPPTDALTWANVGPGAARGLRRLGMPETLDSMKWLYQECQDSPVLGTHVAKHHRGLNEWNESVKGEFPTPYPPFELREIEHSLCEFDKYQRAKSGVGRPREKYDGR